MTDHSRINTSSRINKPDWLRVRLPDTEEYAFLKSQLSKHHLHTICESGNCPNQGECWSLKTATFMILGNTCTRDCKFCNVESGLPQPADTEESMRIAEAVKEIGLLHCVLTSVTRDDLKDGGAGLWAETVKTIKNLCPGVTIETLIPDFKGNTEYIQQIINADPEIISHNLETVRRLTPQVRSRADYDRSLNILNFISSAGANAKTGLMVGLGETDQEVQHAITDIYQTGCRILTIGQYLQPSRSNLPVDRYVHPEIFKEYKNIALETGFRHIESAPLVRSSYHAKKHVNKEETDP